MTSRLTAVLRAAADGLPAGEAAQLTITRSDRVRRASAVQHATAWVGCIQHRISLSNGCPAGTGSVYRWCRGPRQFVLTWLLCRIASDRLAPANHSVLYITVTIFRPVQSGKGRAV